MDRPLVLIIAQAMLAPIGRKIVGKYIGHWNVREGGGLECEADRYGWRIARIEEPDQETAMQRFLRENT